MARYSGARWRPVTRYQPGVNGNLASPMDRYDAGVDHTFVGNVSSDQAFAHFNTPGQATPHFMVNKDGTVDQYIDTAYRSSAVLDGNPRCVTWETWDGYPNGWQDGNAPLDNAEIVEAKAHLMVWLNREHGIPLTQLKSSKPTDRGMGWHRLGIDGNYPEAPGKLLGGRVFGGEHWSKSFGKTCPTDRRIHQFVEATLPRAVVLASQHQPKAVRVWAANLDFATGAKADAPHIAHLCEQADVLLLVECKNLDVRSLLPDGWSCNQDTSSPDRAGSVVAWRTAMFRVGAHRMRLMSKGTGGLLARWANVQTLTRKGSWTRRRYVAAHLAPERFKQLWPAQIAVLHGIRWKPYGRVVMGGDFNQPLGDVATKLRLTPHGPGIVGVLTAPRVKVDGPEVVDRYGETSGATDHPAVGITINQ